MIENFSHTRRTTHAGTTVRIEGGGREDRSIKITYLRTFLTKLLFFLLDPRIPRSWTKHHARPMMQQDRNYCQPFAPRQPLALRPTMKSLEPATSMC